MNQFSSVNVEQCEFTPLGRDVIVSDMVFDERITTGGIVLLNDNGKTTGIRARWGKVYAVGSEQTEVEVGQWVLTEHGRWTRGIEVCDENGKHVLRKVDPDSLLLVSDTQPQDDSWAGSDIAHG